MTEIIAEIGINWDGNFDLLNEMMAKSKEAGCNLVKLQAFERATTNNHPQTERLLKSAVTNKNIEKINDLAKSNNIEWFCTPMYPDAVKLLEPYLNQFKIREIDARELANGKSSEMIDLIIETKKPIIASSEHIPKRNDSIKSRIRWLYCVPKYPCDYKEIDFEKMKKFNGFSNHCPQIDAPINAAKNGAEVIEVHITSNKEDDFIDNNVSFDYNQLSELIFQIRSFDK